MWHKYLKILVLISALPLVGCVTVPRGGLNAPSPNASAGITGEKVGKAAVSVFGGVARAGVSMVPFLGPALSMLMKPSSGPSGSHGVPHRGSLPMMGSKTPEMQALEQIQIQNPRMLILKDKARNHEEPTADDIAWMRQFNAAHPEYGRLMTIVTEQRRQQNAAGRAFATDTP